MPDAPDSPSSRLLALFDQHRLTPTQRRIAHSLVRHAAEAPYLSSVEVAQLADVSQPSVTRFAVALGFDGYPALRARLRTLGLPTRAETDAEVHRNEYVGAVHAEIGNLARLAEQLADPGPVTRAAALLADSRPLVVLGLRTGMAPARGFGYFAAKVLPDVRVIDEGGSLLGDRLDQARAAGATALLCFALPRHPRELTDALRTAKELGLRVVTIADGPFVPAAAFSDAVLVAGVGSQLVFDSCGAPLLLGQVLLQAICDITPADTQTRLEDFDHQAATRGLFED
ncbi:MurR/RpiR family transcriptional regulator [Yinghuangia sp. ASG 101]|uniref:MurR/RpiR family transcriptional regulator n=1 Tax=Yinghuangia sp. ASG 101 TaxID=2896848 RepID=UPI001E49943A|nr:MurR/RpiR family transcriptional regulator [Yinghuangia sp. ASG 101]UGQ14430.1 MurR/RpiR family transcriptional regulator [Yinghuangia sp. ASG 101]